jgi:hypothetical protein
MKTVWARSTSSRDGTMDACFCRIVILLFSCVFYFFAPSVNAQTGGGIGEFLWYKQTVTECMVDFSSPKTK